MKVFILHALVLLFPASLLAEDMVSIETKFIESNSGNVVPHDLTKLKGVKGISICAVPRATPKPGRVAVMAIGDDYRPESAAPGGFNHFIPIGISVSITPYLKSNNIAYDAKFTSSELIPIKTQDSNEKNEIISHDTYITGTVKNDELVWFDFNHPIKGKKFTVCFQLKHEVPLVTTGSDTLSLGSVHTAEKKLWAKSILNQNAPELVVEKWLSEKPSTEGKFVMIDFWATWCPPCREAISELNEYQKKYRDKLVVIGISDESPETVAKFESPKIEYTSAIDTQARTKKLLEVTGIPHVIIIDPKGIVRWEGFPFLTGYELNSSVLDEIFAKYGVSKAQLGAAANP